MQQLHCFQAPVQCFFNLLFLLQTSNTVMSASIDVKEDSLSHALYEGDRSMSTQMRHESGGLMMRT